MKENIYDQDDFFIAYSQFPRSVEGLNAAGEWPALQRLLPNFQGKSVLDLGCGYGWHCLYAAQQGAIKVIGTDISQKMLKVAKEKNRFPTIIEYRQQAIEDMQFADASFDLVVSSLALHYVADFAQICHKIHACLTEKGQFIFSVEHPVFTADGSQDWCYDPSGAKLHWPVNNYFSEGARQAEFLGHKVTKYHKTLTTYLTSLLTAGFSIEQLIEPQPADYLLDKIAGMRDELRRPMMLLVVAKKA
ncbi:class I SAM-dependent methyltransferase [Arsenophonus nasoniae]|uniref:Class I SAM-dependent methyltransferase n=1 Tax=Arsenophonus nasoniae TaxID=638 RepID=A0AA95K8L4_9GAMM|nr:class I SAM-dependent methyltransferase [Arsenophonus nasoniae]WGL96453.1 class I SAM-dependent methyltransferase [Arsenophonus nasoniae]